MTAVTATTKRITRSFVPFDIFEQLRRRKADPKLRWEEMGVDMAA